MTRLLCWLRMSDTAACDGCSGTGQIGVVRCPYCLGTGKLSGKEGPVK